MFYDANIAKAAAASGTVVDAFRHVGLSRLLKDIEGRGIEVIALGGKVRYPLEAGGPLLAALLSVVATGGASDEGGEIRLSHRLLAAIAERPLQGVHSKDR